MLRLYVMYEKSKKLLILFAVVIIGELAGVGILLSTVGGQVGE